MSESILTCRQASLDSTLKALAPPADAFMFLEIVPTARLDPADRARGIRLETYDSRVDWARWERGRVFCPEWELRWEGSQAVYIGPPVHLPHFEPGPDLSAFCPHDREYYLWDTRQGQRFLELQIARPLFYPVAMGDRVKIQVVEWLDDTGEVVAWRCARLRGAP